MLYQSLKKDDNRANLGYTILKSLFLGFYCCFDVIEKDKQEIKIARL